MEMEGIPLYNKIKPGKGYVVLAACCLHNYLVKKIKLVILMLQMWKIVTIQLQLEHAETIQG